MTYHFHQNNLPSTFILYFLQERSNCFGHLVLINSVSRLETTLWNSVKMSNPLVLLLSLDFPEDIDANK